MLADLIQGKYGRIIGNGGVLAVKRKSGSIELLWKRGREPRTVALFALDSNFPCMQPDHCGKQEQSGSVASSSELTWPGKAGAW